MNLKNKLISGLLFLFAVIFIFGSVSVYYFNRLSNDSKKILQNNYESLVYSNNMLKALEEIPAKAATDRFIQNLGLQEANITEAGEREATEQLRKNFSALLSGPADSVSYAAIRQSLQSINDLNQQAIAGKNRQVNQTAENVKFWLTAIFVLLAIVTLTFVINFPGIISSPIKALNEGIREIANKNYHQRIQLKQNDEFGELASAFNEMAEKLDQYENSNLAQLRFEKRRIETIINQMKDGIIGLDKKKHILFLNEVAESLLSVKETDLAGKYAADIALQNDLMRQLLQPDNKKELKIYADSKESYFNKEIIDVTYEDEMIGQVIVVKNITSFYELNAAKTNFIATVSHELKTPISSIKMSASLLSDERIGNANEEQKELVKSIADDAERLLKITSELLNMAQVETGNMQLKMLPVQPHVIIEQAVQAVGSKAQQKHIRLQINVAESLPPVTADLEKTSWVLINFLTNAIRYSPEKTMIKISAMEKASAIVFSVKDTGRGIEEKYLNKVFDKYFKVPGSTDAGGTGLGLAISKEFIEAQGGTITAKSEIGVGSVFGFEMPKVN